MWLDDDPRKSLETKVRDAAARYRQRLGQPPGLCLVHAPAMSAPGETREVTLEADAASAVLVMTSRQVPLHCLWLGMPEPAEP
jgi:hypothetical protein